MDALILIISAIVAGIAFVTLAATNVVVMLEASQPSRNHEHAEEHGTIILVNTR